MKEKMLNLAKDEKERKKEKTFLELAKGFWRVKIAHIVMNLKQSLVAFLLC